MGLDNGHVRPLPPLPVAAARGDLQALTALLAEGIDINATTRSQPRSCLMEACKGNSDKAVDFLIARRWVLSLSAISLLFVFCLSAACYSE